MNYKDYKSIAKKVSKEVLFDGILNRELCKDEHRAFMEEINKRGVQDELSTTISDNNARKGSVMDSAKDLSQQDLFNIILYNIDNFTEEELIVFKNEANQRGLQEELSVLLKEKAKSDKEFQDKAANSSDNIVDLLNTFQEHMFEVSPGLKEKVEKAEKKSSANRIIGAVLLLIGVLLIYKTGGNTISFGVTVLGVFFIVIGILK
ncbi:hypothetical protein M4I21_05205 [Cellulophaga sp. 20_2_10]|uniref:hypothetical protein n=1 Tax=Cellulophaga sp. 20_2_10 TaxID=2942476 RepID=UPI00201A99FD|nr:hypothetical protein [Cellulophaga sp. 20_2_10]MCL5245196.1 hypothetical protein [Cellulophaga sp. 20_2_10]